MTLIPAGEFYNKMSPDLKIEKVAKSDAGVYQCKASNAAGIDMSQQVEVTVKAKSDTTCTETPFKKIFTLPPNCEKQEVDIGMCNKNDIKAMCLHPSQLQNLTAQECSDPPSEYCCGPVETLQEMVNCNVPNAGSDKSRTYQIPVPRVTRCGCTKC